MTPQLCPPPLTSPTNKQTKSSRRRVERVGGLNINICLVGWETTLTCAFFELLLKGRHNRKQVFIFSCWSNKGGLIYIFRAFFYRCNKKILIDSWGLSPPLWVVRPLKKTYFCVCTANCSLEYWNVTFSVYSLKSLKENVQFVVKILRIWGWPGHPLGQLQPLLLLRG